MYKLGIIGGMGPLATAKFYEKVVLKTNAHSDNEHIDTVILSHSTIPDRTKCIMSGDSEAFLEEIKKDFEIMNDLGVERIAIPCNTSHYFFDEYRRFTDIDVVNMVEETVRRIHALGYKRAFVFGTTGTVSSQVYEKYGTKYGVEILQISEPDQKRVMDIIYKIKEDSGTNDNNFNEIIDKYVSKEAIGIIACTELSMVDIDNENTIDALNVLVEEAINNL